MACRKRWFISPKLDAHYLDGYTQSTSATANSIARRDASGHLTVNDLTGDQGIFTNSTVQQH